MEKYAERIGVGLFVSAIAGNIIVGLAAMACVVHKALYISIFNI